MPKLQTDHLVRLILSLSKAEKRHFRLFVKRNQATGDILFLILFDAIEKAGEYDEEAILKKHPQIKKRQLSNLKAHLYRQLLISLRLLHKNNYIDIDLRERIDYARVLYNKGLYRASLDILERVKEKALAYNQYGIVGDILEFEKLIESQYITRSIASKADTLAKESEQITQMFNKSHAFSNLALKMYSFYLKTGYAKNLEDHESVRHFFHENLPPYSFEELNFYGKIYYLQSYHWFYYINQDFLHCYRYAQRWVDLFEEFPEMMKEEAPLYLKGIHSLLNALFNLLHYQRFVEVIALLEDVPNRIAMPKDNNVEGLFMLYKSIHQIKRHYLEGTFSEGISLVDPIMRLIEEDTYGWDDHRVMVFYYRFACLYFGSDDYSRAIDYLNLIINQKTPDYREDIQSFARILNLIAHYELGNAQLVEYQIKSVYRFLLNMKEMHHVQRAIFSFLRKLPRTSEEDLPPAFVKLKNELVEIQKDPYERRPFLYLDIISWLESKIEEKSVQSIVQAKHATRQQRSWVSPS